MIKTRISFTLQSEWPQTMMCLMSLCTHPSSRAAGSHVVYSSRKCCECGIKLPAFLTKQIDKNNNNKLTIKNLVL